jgi:hypothetical protein
LTEKDCQHPAGGFRAPAQRGTLPGDEDSMTDRAFYLALTLLVLTLAAGEIVYGVFGPFSAPLHQVDELSSINRTR